MAKKITIAVDAMGGDYSPEKVIDGISLYLEKSQNVFFNIFGAIIWYPLKCIPISMAKTLGKLVIKYKWFGVFYIFYNFGLIPLLLFSSTYIIDTGIVGTIIGIIIDICIIITSFLLFKNFDTTCKFICNKNREIIPI